ncbi:MAG: DUF177 domain-containing protein [Sphaerobacter sp.]|nr:DUF177 domain-containing protein [Sphaerobacter sp.]
MDQRLPDLMNDTVVNVAQLLKQPVGATRTFDLQVARVPLDDELSAREVRATIRLTRIETGILAHGEVTGVVSLVCVRCLTEFDQPFRANFDGEFRPSVDVRSGEALPIPEDDDELFIIDHNHELDVEPLLRQVILLALPMRPVCGDQCAGFQPTFPADDEEGDERLAVLRTLLGEGQA